MENITHSLVGATLAEIALPSRATDAQRRLFYIAGIVAANLPDADLIYTRITPPPLGYLLHHRGHTHTVVGAALLAIGIWLAARFIPPLKRSVAESPSRFWTLIAAALGSHLVLDWWNSYGVHPFWPLDNRWYYGDAINIVEPWLWLLLGIGVVMNARSVRSRTVIGGGLIALTAALTWFRMISLGAVVALAVAGGVLASIAWRLPSRTRAVAALAGTALFVAGMFGLNRVAFAAASTTLRASQQGEIVDVVLSPNAAAPFCWRALAIEKNEAAGEYALRRGAIALFDGWLPRSSCIGDAQRAAPVPGPSRSTTIWFTTVQEPLGRLRQLAHDDCWVRAWLQFGRAPSVADGRIADLRFGDGGFTEIRLLPTSEARVCPPNLTPWSMPRADLVGPLEN